MVSSVWFPCSTKSAVEGQSQTLGRLAEHLKKVVSGSEFVMTRVLDAPRDFVFNTFTEPEHLLHWWSAKGLTPSTCKIDLRPGGVFHYGMRFPDGREMWGKWVFREVAAPERMVFVSSFSDEAGGMARHIMAPDWPLEMHSTISFADDDGKTSVTFRAVPINATDLERSTFVGGRESMRMGWGGTLDQLDQYLASVQSKRRTGR